MELECFRKSIEKATQTWSPNRSPGGLPGSSFGDFSGPKESALIRFSGLRNVFAAISVFRRPRTRPGPPRDPPGHNFWLFWDSKVVVWRKTKPKSHLPSGSAWFRGVDLSNKSKKVKTYLRGRGLPLPLPPPRDPGWGGSTSLSAPFHLPWAPFFDVRSPLSFY